MAKGEMRPTFNEDAIALEERDEDGTVITEQIEQLLIIKNR